MKIRVLAVLSLLVVATGVLPGAEAPAKKPITHEDVWLMKRLDAPVPSPDGKWVVFGVTEPAYDSKETSSDLWLKSLTDESPARRITFSKPAEGGVTWSPDSRKLAFTAKRDADEVAQVYVLDLASGGEAERITSLSTGASAPKWSPDGTRLLFVSSVYPGANDDEANKKAAKERKDRKYNARAYETFAVKEAWSRSPGMKRTYNSYLEIVPDLADKDKEVILARMNLAREAAMLTDADKEIVNIYKRHKVKVEQYIGSLEWAKLHSAFAKKGAEAEAAKKKAAAEKK